MSGPSLKRVVVVREATRSYRDVAGRGGASPHMPAAPGQSVPGKISFTTSSPVLYVPAAVARACGLVRPVIGDGSFTVRLA